MQQSTGQALFDLLVTRNFEPVILDSSGKEISDPNEGELFSFDWKTAQKNYGTVVVLLGPDNELEIYYGDNLGRSMEIDDRKEWYNFLEIMKNFATKNMLTFEVNNLNRLKYTMQGIAAIKEGLFEGYYGKRNMSYSDQPKQTRLVIKHTRNLDETEARFRAIESLFVETADGERFKVPSRNLMHGKMLARHVAEGGNPYDAFGQHINSTVEEMAVLSRFVRAARNKNFGGDAAALTSEAIQHYRDLKDKAKKMISQRGYHMIRDEFDPLATTQSEIAVENIKNMFVEQTLDTRIEEALPLLARLAAPVVMSEPAANMQELSEFEDWANGMTSSKPNDRSTKRLMQQLMMEPLPAGPDGINAIEQLSELIDDPKLLDRIQDIADVDPDADVFQDSGVLSILGQYGFSAPAEPADPEPAEPEAADSAADDIDAAVQPTQEDIDTDGVMMTRPSNMSSESRDPVSRFRQLVELIRQ